MLFSHACLKMCSNETVRMKLSSPQIGAQFYRTFLPKFMQENRRPKCIVCLLENQRIRKDT